MDRPQDHPEYGALRQAYEEQQARIAHEPVELDDETISALVELGDLLRLIRADLEAEGYRFIDGIILPPDQGL